MKLNISSAFIISGTPFIAQCAYSITATPTRCSFTGVYDSVTVYRIRQNFQVGKLSRLEYKINVHGKTSVVAASFIRMSIAS